MRRHQLQTAALVLMWVGGIEVVTSFLAKVWFQYVIHFTPFFFLALIVGMALFLVTRLV